MATTEKPVKVHHCDGCHHAHVSGASQTTDWNAVTCKNCLKKQPAPATVEPGPDEQQGAASNETVVTNALPPQTGRDLARDVAVDLPVAVLDLLDLGVGEVARGGAEAADSGSVAHEQVAPAIPRRDAGVAVAQRARAGGFGAGDEPQTVFGRLSPAPRAPSRSGKCDGSNQTVYLQPIEIMERRTICTLCGKTDLVIKPEMLADKVIARLPSHLDPRASSRELPVVTTRSTTPPTRSAARSRRPTKCRRK